jgi:hypothetical protein
MARSAFRSTCSAVEACSPSDAMPMLAAMYTSSEGSWKAWSSWLTTR